MEQCDSGNVIDYATDENSTLHANSLSTLTINNQNQMYLMTENKRNTMRTSEI